MLICCADPDITRRWLEGIDTLDSVRCIRDAAGIDELRVDPTPSPALIDLEAPGIGGTEAAVALCRRHPQIAFIFLSSRPETAEGLTLIGAGGRGYCNRYILPELLHKAVEVVAMGEVWLGRRLVEQLLKNQGRAPAPAVDGKAMAGYIALTPREREVARMVAHGASNKVIARSLGISERTVKAHMSAIFGKTETRDRLQLGLLARSWPLDDAAQEAARTKVQ